MPKINPTANPTNQKKNPYAVAVGSRMKQARIMAEYASVHKLLEKHTEWKTIRSRISNYEAGISLAPPEFVKQWAELTNTSACWIYFGAGPIRPTARDNQAIRHQNLLYLSELTSAKKTLTPWLQHIGLSKKKLNELIDNPFKNINERIARRSEAFFKHPKGWMDEQHIENDPVCQSFPDDLREIMTIFSNLDSEERQQLVQIAKTFVKIG